MRLTLAESAAGQSSGRAAVPNPRTDTRLADQVIEKISEETHQIFDQLKAGMLDEASFKTVEANVARNYIIATLGEIRGEAYRDAAASARRFAEHCGRASQQLEASHHRLVARCVSELFDQFASRLEGIKQVGEPPVPPSDKEAGTPPSEGKPSTQRGS